MIAIGDDSLNPHGIVEYVSPKGPYSAFSKGKGETDTLLTLTLTMRHPHAQLEGGDRVERRKEPAVAERVEYDEFGLFHENASEYGLPFDTPPVVRRVFVEVKRGRRLSALVWQARDPELVLLHGGSQNAHTWDTVAMALDRPLLAIDLPGHGHSDGPGDQPEPHLNTQSNAADVAVAVRQLAPTAKGVVGMSRGGITTIALCAQAPELVRKIVLVDVLPGTKRERAKRIVDFINGPPSFASLDELLDRTAQVQPEPVTDRHFGGASCITPCSSLTGRGSGAGRGTASRFCGSPSRRKRRSRAYEQLWETVSRLTVPLLLVRGMRPGSVLVDEDEEELRRRLPSAQIVHMEEAGHSIQGDAPLELASLIKQFVFGN